MVPPKPSRRLVPLDALRGILMGLMAIDHASLLVRGVHFFEAWNVPAPTHSGAASFLTRFVTHFCAPGFFFLMGAGMTLRGITRRGRTILVFRGVLLVLLEQLVVDPVLYGQVRWVEFGVLSTLGVSMVAGALLSSLDSLLLAATGAGFALLGQLAPLLASGRSELPLWAHLLLLPGGPGNWFVLYPVLPWLGIVILGMAFGRLAATTPSRAYRLAGVAGVAGLAAFALLRTGALPGGWMAFLALVKYPPALDFLLLTLGVNLSVLWLLSRVSERWLTPLIDYGRSALVFYLLHWHVLALLAPRFRRGHLGPMYAAWALTMMVMYPICVVWGRFRQELRPGSPLRLL